MYRDSGTYSKPSDLHCLLDKGSGKMRVKLGGYVMTTSPARLGSDAVGYANGNVGFCQRKVGCIFVV